MLRPGTDPGPSSPSRPEAAGRGLRGGDASLDDPRYLLKLSLTGRVIRIR